MAAEPVFPDEFYIDGRGINRYLPIEVKKSECTAFYNG